MSELPKSWSIPRLGELVTITMGQAPPGSACNKVGNGVPFVKVGEFSAERPTIREWTTEPLKFAKRSDVLVCVVGATCGKINYGEDCAIGRSVAALSPCDDLKQRYLHKFLSTKVYDLRSGAAGSAQGVISKDDLESIEIPLPPPPEQSRIIAKLDSLSARTKTARHELARIPLLIEHYKQAILEKAFSGELTADWRESNPGQLAVAPRNLKDIKKKYISNDEPAFSPPYIVPDSWSWLRLPEVGDLDRGKSKHRPRNDPMLYGGDYPFVQTGEVREADRYLRAYSKTYNDRGLAQSRLWPKGTLCITIAANIAETAILDIEACFPDSVVGFIPDDDRISSSYTEFFLRTMKADLEAFAPATAQKNINLETLSSVRVPVPPLSEQAEIVRLIEAAMDWLNVVADEQGQAARLLDHLDQGLLAKAFRGELVPQDPNDEPAEKLLERIRAKGSVPLKARRGRLPRSREAAKA